MCVHFLVRSIRFVFFGFKFFSRWQFICMIVLFSSHKWWMDLYSKIEMELLLLLLFVIQSIQFNSIQRKYCFLSMVHIWLGSFIHILIFLCFFCERWANEKNRTVHGIVLKHSPGHRAKYKNGLIHSTLIPLNGRCIEPLFHSSYIPLNSVIGIFANVFAHIAVE